MSILVLEGYMIHKQISGDTSLKLTCLTRDKGMIEGLYRGARTPKKQAAIQPFTSLWLSVYEKNHHYYFNSIESTQSAPILTSFSLFSALYLNELMVYTVTRDEPEAILYDCYVQTLQHLASAQTNVDLEIALRLFEKVLLETCGYSLLWTKEALTHQSIRLDEYYRYQAGLGFIQAKQGFLGKHILAIAVGALGDREVLKTAKLILRQAVHYLLNGKELKSRHLFLKSSR